jgi:hypothetical protein
MDISAWDSSDFEYLVRLLLQAEGNQSVQSDARAHDVGVDLTVADPCGRERGNAASRFTRGTPENRLE